MSEEVYVIYSIHMGNMEYYPIAYKDFEEAKEVLQKYRNKLKTKNSIRYGISEWTVK